MRLYVCMTACGSICTLMYILLNSVLPYELPLKWRRGLLRVNIVFYLLPLPWFAAELKVILRTLLEITAGIRLPEAYAVDETIIYRKTDLWRSMLVFDQEGKLIYITGYEFLPAIKAVLVFYMTALVLWIALYLRISCQYRQNMVFLDRDHRYMVDQNTGRKAAVGISPCVSSPVAVGLFRPVILLPVDYDVYDTAMQEVLLHELNHVSSMDTIERFLCFGVVAAHVLNPLSHYLFWEAVAVGEMTSDDAALRDRTKKQKAEYIRCIMTASQHVGRSVLLAPSLGISKSLLRRRMERIMDTGGKKIWTKKMAAVLTVICVLASSIPAMAYQKPVCLRETDGEEFWKGFDMAVVTPPGTECPLEEKTTDFSRGDELVIDADGRVYSALAQEHQDHSSCVHRYQPVTYFKHTKDSDRHCTEVRYHAVRCADCGDLIKGEEMINISYKPCPH